MNYLEKIFLIKYLKKYIMDLYFTYILKYVSSLMSQILTMGWEGNTNKKNIILITSIYMCFYICNIMYIYMII